MIRGERGGNDDVCSALVVARRKEGLVGHHRGVRWASDAPRRRIRKRLLYFSHFFFFFADSPCPPSFLFFPLLGDGANSFPLCCGRRRRSRHGKNCSPFCVRPPAAFPQAVCYPLPTSPLLGHPPPLLRFCAVFALPKAPPHACLPRGARKE